MLHWRHYVCAVRRGFCHVFSPSRLLSRAKYCFSFRKNTERISMKLAVGRPNHYQQQIKWLHLLHNWNRNKGQATKKIESTLVGLAVMSNRCWHLANEFTNSSAQTTADAIADTISGFHLQISYRCIKNFTAIFFIQHFSTVDMDTFICPFVRCAFLLAIATPVQTVVG